MDRSQLLAIVGVFTLTVVLSLSIDSTAIFEDTLIAFFVLLLSTGVALRGSAPYPSRATDNKRLENDAISLPVFQAAGGSSASAGRLDSLRRLHLIDVDQADERIFLWLTGVLLVRVEVTRAIFKNISCASSGFGALVPLAVTGSLLFLSRGARTKQKTNRRGSRDHPQTITSSGSLLSLTVLCFSAVLVQRLSSSRSSTYICTSSSPATWQTPLIQHFSTILDVAILTLISSIITTNGQTSGTGAVCRLTGSASIVAAIVLIFIHTIYYFIMHPFFPRLPSISIPFFWSLGKMAPLVSAFCVCALRTSTLLDLPFTITAATLLGAVSSALATAFNDAFVPGPYHLAPIAIAIMLVSSLPILRAKLIELSPLHKSTVRSRSIWQVIYLGFGVAVTIYVAARAHATNILPAHPIDLLMTAARAQQAQLLASGKQSRNLAEAIDNYSVRYGRLPPPHFDRWYEYATSRQSLFIDNFDSIHQDLLPFYGLPPVEIRKRTLELIANPWNGISAISIRKGKAYLGPRIGVKEEGAMEGMRGMINKFASHLPDMDVAFNIEDEPRVAVPFERKKYLVEMAHLHEIVHVSQTQFQPGRSMHWPRIPDEAEDNTVFREVAYHAVWEQFATVGCSPWSAARTQHLWSLGSLCSSCSEPHSANGILSNWTMAADVCHQPDLANLHGFLMGHDAYKGTNKLYPVFSTAKMAGFNDILYPSYASYLDAGKPKQSVDTAWPAKNSTLFWRGGTTEGVSFGDRRWQGMLRQRIVHLANNIKNTSPAAAVLLPRAGSSPSFEANQLPAAQVQRLMQSDVQITPDITRCRDSDCDLQRWEFAPSPDMHDFATHVQHKYLLDLDGRGWSSHFLPFLRSESVPFKVGLFQEWWHDRVTPWLHFVPIDVRGHGLWNTLAYFVGMDGTVNGKAVRMEAREDEARKIAMAGVEWASQTLRGEDMEVYMFRLLLEWGRMTDDWRDEIGFSGNKGVSL